MPHQTGARTVDPTSHIKSIVELKEQGRCDPAPMVTYRLGFNCNDVNRAYRMYEEHLDNIIKVVMSIKQGAEQPFRPSPRPLSWPGRGKYI